MTGDSRTKGVELELSASDTSNGHMMSATIRNEWGNDCQRLSSTELYTLLAMADEQRKTWPSADVYKVYYYIMKLASVSTPLMAY